jgi:predicted RNase H-like HicB family nuclease
MKDDTRLMEGITRRQKDRRSQGLPDRDEGPSDLATRQAEWQRMQQARTAPWTYYVVIEYHNGVYHAQALSFPQVTAQGETVEAAKANLAQALQAHLAEWLARGELVPMREYKRVETVEVCLEELPAPPPAVAEEPVAP